MAGQQHVPVMLDRVVGLLEQALYNVKAKGHLGMLRKKLGLPA